MASLRPVEVFGLEVPPGEEPVPAIPPGQFPATFRVTMAAIDPTISKEEYAQVNGTPAFHGATLRIIRVPEDSDSDSDEDDEDFDMAQLLNSNSSDDESLDDDEEDDEDLDDEEDDEEINGGPSDPSKSPKAKRAAVRQKFSEALAADGHDMEVDEDDDDDEELGSKLTAKQKGKAKAIDLDDMDDSDEDEFEEGQGADELVLCTLDISRNYQQPLDITVNEHETVYFQVSGTHSVYLTGNILIPEDLQDGMYDSDEDSDEAYDLPPDDDELELPDEEDESDGLDDLDDPRLTEIMSEDDEEAAVAPPLIKPNGASKGKKKRARDESDDEAADTNNATLDDLISKSLKPAAPAATAQVNGIDESKLSKKQLKNMRKKLKDNAGKAVEKAIQDAKEDLGVAAGTSEQTPGGSAKSDKKVQFAKTLVQGPSNSSTPSSDSKKPEDAKAKVNGDAKEASKKPGPGPRNVQGVTVDDKKLGSGPASKKGDKVSLRYIGKLDKDKKVFDSNTKGKPFTFTLGASQVIKGWDIGIQGMTVGGERRITIPSHLAYGTKGAGKDIPPNATLVFDVKMLNIA